MVRYNQKMVVVVMLLGFCGRTSMQGAGIQKTGIQKIGMQEGTRIPSEAPSYKSPKEFPSFIIKLLQLQARLASRIIDSLPFPGGDNTKISGPNPTFKELATEFYIGVLSQAFAPVGWIGAGFALAAAESRARMAAIGAGMATTATVQGLAMYYLAKKAIGLIKK